jgi:hypothetical protein
MKHPTRLIVVLVLLLSSGTWAQATRPTTQPAGKVVRLLTVGNSFAGNSTRFLAGLATAGGDTLVLGQANPGGCSLERHWKAAAAFEANPTDPAGLIYVVGPKDKPQRMSLKQMLLSQSWDYVTIQQASPLSDNADSYFPYAANLHEYIRRNAPTATVLVHQTWAYRADHSKFAQGGSPAEMHEKVRTNYHTLAAKLKLDLLPVGDAMFTVMSDPAFAYVPDPNFDASRYQPPHLPWDLGGVHQSYRWQKNRMTGQDELVRDAYHANARGCYIGSAVFYEVLFGKSVVGNRFFPKDLKAAEALWLQQVAHDTVAKYRAGATTQPVAKPLATR